MLVSVVKRPLPFSKSASKARRDMDLVRVAKVRGFGPSEKAVRMGGSEGVVVRNGCRVEGSVGGY